MLSLEKFFLVIYPSILNVHWLLSFFFKFFSLIFSDGSLMFVFDFINSEFISTRIQWRKGTL